MKTILKDLKSGCFSIFQTCPILFRVALMDFLFTFDIFMFFFFQLPLYLHIHLKFSATLVGLMTSTFLLAETFTKAPCGWLGDKIGRRKLIIFGPLVLIFSPIIMTMLRSPYPFFFLRALDGIAMAAFWPSVFALVGDTVEEAQRAKAMSIFNLTYIMGIVLGPAIGSRLVELSHSHLFLFYFASFIFLVTTILAFLMLPKNKIEPVFTKPQIISPHQLSFATKNPNSLLIGMLSTMLLVIFLTMFGFFILNPAGLIYVNRVLKFEFQHIGLLFLAPAFPVVLLAIPLGRLGDEIGKSKAIKSGLMICALASWLFPLAKSFITLVSVLIVLAIGFLIATPSWLALATELTERARGAVVGLMGTMQGLGALFGPTLGGYLYDQVAPVAPFYGCAFLVTLAAVIALVFVREPSIS